jgi:hypothetical protein
MKNKGIKNKRLKSVVVDSAVSFVARSVEDSLWWTVRGSVRMSVENSIRMPVWRSVRWSVGMTVVNSIKRKVSNHLANNQ